MQKEFYDFTFSTVILIFPPRVDELSSPRVEAGVF